LEKLGLNERVSKKTAIRDFKELRAYKNRIVKKGCLR